MREELNVEAMESVAGGKYIVNGNTNQVAFKELKQVYNLKNCTVYDAMKAMDSLIGKYDSEEEYDQACIDLLKSKGWI